MKFIDPSFLWALLALAIPIIVHLFHFRRYKTIQFSNVQFLKEVKQERNNVRNVKRWLLLLSRLFALFFMVMAFAQPFLKGKNADKVNNNAVSIYLDNSYSMGLKNKGVELMEWGRDRAKDVVNSYSERDQFLILTNGLNVEEQRWKSKEDALNYIDDIQLSNATVGLDKILSKQNYLFSKSEADVLQNYIISDFQESMLANANIEKDSLQQHHFIQLKGDNVKNIFVDSVWMVNPVSRIGGNNAILYSITNSSELDAKNIRVKLSINNQVQTIRELNLIVEEQRTDTLYFNLFKEGWQLASIQISDYPITADDEFFFSFNVPKTRNVLEVYDGNADKIISGIFQNDNLITFKNSRSNQLDYSKFVDYDLIILNELTNVSSGLSNSINKYVEAGGNVLLVPSKSATNQTYATILNNLGGVQLAEKQKGNYQLLKPNLNNKLLSSVVEKLPSNADFPSIKQYFPIVASNRVRKSTILKLNNNDALLAAFPKGNGNVFIQSVANNADFSNFQAHWLYAPLVYNLSLQKSLDQPLYYTRGDNQWVGIDYKLERKDNVVALSSNDFEFIPEQRVVNNRLFINADKNEQLNAGHYAVTANNSDLANLSFNLNRLESEMKFADKADLEKQFPNLESLNSGLNEQLQAEIKTNNQGKPLWRYCIILAILFLIAEVAIIKLLPG